MTWDYIAGFFDGEGHVGLHPDGKHRNRLDVYVGIANTHLPSLRAMRAFLAANNVASTIYMRRIVDKVRKPIGILRITDHTAQDVFISKMVELSIIKREPSGKVLQHIRSKDWLVPFSGDQLRDALASYERGESLRDIEASHGISSRTLRKHAARKGVVMRARGEAVALAIKRRK